MPTEIIKNNSNILSKFLGQTLTALLKQVFFPEQLKYADVKPVFKNDSRTDNTNYRTISVPPNISKIKWCLIKQLVEYFLALLCKYQCGFRKDLS